MPITLHQAFVPGSLQILRSVASLIDIAKAHCAETGLPEADLVEDRLIQDMHPFSYQVKSCTVHSQGAIEGLRNGVFSPDFTEPPTTLDGLMGRVLDAIGFLEGVSVEELEEFIGKPMRFEFGEFRMDFTAEDFLLSFSQPNFYFHATTAYDLLRKRGVQVGKRDFLGAVRIKR